MEAAHERRVDAHDRARVVELSTIIGSRKQRHELALREELVAVLDDLMGDDRSVEIKSLEAAKLMKINWLVLGCIEADFSN